VSDLPETGERAERRSDCNVPWAIALGAAGAAAGVGISFLARGAGMT